jgi:hypothetical protein
MIYAVDHVFSDAGLEPAWHEWYAGYVLRLLSVPGISSAQRFRAIDQRPPRYLSLYSIDSEAVFTSEAYKNIGGGGSQSTRFHHAYELWTRNLFDGARYAPAVARTHKLLVWDRTARERIPALDDRRLTWLRAVGLHRTTPWRALVVLEAAEPAEDMRPSGSFVYEPFTRYIEARRPA